MSLSIINSVQVPLLTVTNDEIITDLNGGISWVGLNTPLNIISILKGLGYERPSLGQCLLLKCLALMEPDEKVPADYNTFFIQAKNGTGKTLAIVMGAIMYCLSFKKEPKDSQMGLGTPSPNVVIITHTETLARQFDYYVDSILPPELGLKKVMLTGDSTIPEYADILIVSCNVLPYVFKFLHKVSIVFIDEIDSIVKSSIQIIYSLFMSYLNISAKIFLLSATCTDDTINLIDTTMAYKRVMSTLYGRSYPLSLKFLIPTKELVLSNIKQSLYRINPTAYDENKFTINITDSNGPKKIIIKGLNLINTETLVNINNSAVPAGDPATIDITTITKDLEDKKLVAYFLDFFKNLDEYNLEKERNGLKRIKACVFFESTEKCKRVYKTLLTYLSMLNLKTKMCCLINDNSDTINDTSLANYSNDDSLYDLMFMNPELSRGLNIPSTRFVIIVIDRENIRIDINTALQQMGRTGRFGVLGAVQWVILDVINDEELLTILEQLSLGLGITPERVNTTDVKILLNPEFYHN